MLMIRKGVFDEVELVLSNKICIKCSRWVKWWHRVGLFY